MASLAPALDRYLDGRYRAANPTWHVEDSAWKAGHVCELLERHRVAPASVADVGCGAGEVLRLLHSRFPSARCAGFDVSPDALGEARARGARAVLFYVHASAARRVRPGATSAPRARRTTSICCAGCSVLPFTTSHARRTRGGSAVASSTTFCVSGGSS